MRLTQSLAVFALIGAATVPALALQETPQLPGQVDASRVTAGTYATDPSHSLVGWSVDHFGFNDYYGLFGDVEGTLQIDPADLESAMVDVTIPITSVAVPSEGLRNHLLRPGKEGDAASDDEEEKPQLVIGDTIELRSGKIGTVRYIGEVHFADGEWIGVELHDHFGKHDGAVRGVRYFCVRRNAVYS